MTSQEREELEVEYWGRLDAQRERFASELGQCMECGAPTVDPAGHCEGREGVPELPGAGREFRPFKLEPALADAVRRDEAADDIPF